MRITNVRRCPNCSGEFRPEIEICPDCQQVLEHHTVIEGDPSPGLTTPTLRRDAKEAYPLQQDELTWLRELGERLEEQGVAHRIEPAHAAPGAHVLLISPHDLAPANRIRDDYYRDRVPDARQIGELAEDRCPACGAAVPADAVECRDCGLAFPELSEDEGEGAAES